MKKSGNYVVYEGNGLVYFVLKRDIKVFEKAVYKFDKMCKASYILRYYEVIKKRN